MFRFGQQLVMLSLHQLELVHLPGTFHKLCKFVVTTESFPSQRCYWILLIHSEIKIGNSAADSTVLHCHSSTYTSSVSKEAGAPRGTMHLLGVMTGASGASGRSLDICLHDHMDTMTKFHAAVEGDTFTITITSRHMTVLCINLTCYPLMQHL